MVLAPASVILALVVFQDVLVAFAVYHVGVCLLAPLVYEKGIQEATWAEVARSFGLTRLTDRRAWLAGTGVGVLMFFGMLVPYLVVGRASITPGDVQAVLASWQVGPGDTALLFVYMLVVNSGAEELFWRGYIHDRLAGWSNRWGALVLASGAFASYHWFTVWALTDQALVASVAVVGVFVGGLIWAWLRERYGTVLPALLAHGGATLGYMTVYAVYLV